MRHRSSVVPAVAEEELDVDAFWSALEPEAGLDFDGLLGEDGSVASSDLDPLVTH